MFKFIFSNECQLNGVKIFYILYTVHNEYTLYFQKLCIEKSEKLKTADKYYLESKICHQSENFAEQQNFIFV